LETGAATAEVRIGDEGLHFVVAKQEAAVVLGEVVGVGQKGGGAKAAVGGSGLRGGVQAVSEKRRQLIALELPSDGVGVRIGVSVLCPSWVNTNLLSAERNRPEQLSNPPDTHNSSAQEIRILNSVRDAVAKGMSAKEVAEQVFEAVRANRFYIITHPESKAAIQARMEDILRGNNPRFLSP